MTVANVTLLAHASLHGRLRANGQLRSSLLLVVGSAWGFQRESCQGDGWAGLSAPPEDCRRAGPCIAHALCMLCAAVLTYVLCRYFAAMEVEDVWCVYPWDADDIYAHTEAAEGAGTHLPGAARSKRQSSGGSPVQLANGHEIHGAAASNGHVAKSADAAAVGNGSHI